jgi:UPF0755 protein
VKGKRRQQQRLGESKLQRQRRSAVSRVFVSLFLLIALGVVALTAAGLIGYRSYVAEGPLQAPKIFEIGKGLGAPEIAAQLEQHGIIADDRVFSIAALVTGARGRLKAGEYEFPARASIRDVMNIIASGKSIVYKLTIPEGWTTEMALARVRENDVLTGELTITPGEGEILPETYVFRRGKTRDELVSEMVEAQTRLIEEIWSTRSPTAAVKTPQEAVILASIVEKETAIPEERPDVAAVFSNRLRKNMKLQSDPTIIYGLVGGKGKLDRPLSKADIAGQTPYNTYQVTGLPPGPIANPGRAALEAVLNPSASRAIYFVADGSGGHAFAETLAEHNANVQKWRNIERNRALIAAQEAELEAAAATPPAAPQEAAEAEAAESAETKVETPALPDMATVQPDNAAAPAAKPAAEPEPAADPLFGEPASPTAAVASEGAGEAGAAAPASAPTPQVKPRPIAAEPERKPGDVIMIANRPVPIPMPKPKRP